LTDMNLLDPRDGSLIDNADIKYLSSIQIQGGGIVDEDLSAPLQNWLTTKLGQTPATQFNSAMAMTISNSNLDHFSDAAVFVHPDLGNALDRDLSVLASGGIPTPVRDTTVKGQGVVLFMVNNTITNSDVGIQANADTTGLTSITSPIELVLENNTFYNN